MKDLLQKNLSKLYKVYNLLALNFKIMTVNWRETFLWHGFNKKKLVVLGIGSLCPWLFFLVFSLEVTQFFFF